MFWIICLKQESIWKISNTSISNFDVDFIFDKRKNQLKFVTFLKNLYYQSKDENVITNKGQPKKALDMGHYDNRQSSWGRFFLYFFISPVG